MKHASPVFAILLICTLAHLAQAKRAPNLELKDLAGNQHKISELQGSVAVVNFWATWCGPCKVELPLLSQLSQEYAAKKVRFIAASADEAKDLDKVLKYRESEKPALEIWVGADLDMLDSAKLGNELPATMILDERGEVVARILGQAHEEDIRAVLDWLLGGRSGPAPAPITKRY
jgi:thiol-disulfide isomerase/thioredoxin